MGVDYSTYVGGYIRVHNPERPTEKKFYSCTNRECKRHGQEVASQFCPDCGCHIGLITGPDRQRIHFDVYEEFDERLCKIRLHGEWSDTNIYISNKNALGGVGKTYDSRCHQVVSLSEDAVIHTLTQMENDFAKEIVRLKEVFGADAVKVEFGVIIYTW